MLTFFHHANSHTLLKAAELAAIASPLVHRAVLVSQTHVLSMLLNSSLQNGHATLQNSSHFNIAILEVWNMAMTKVLSLAKLQNDGTTLKNNFYK